MSTLSPTELHQSLFQAAREFVVAQPAVLTSEGHWALAMGELVRACTKLAQTFPTDPDARKGYLHQVAGLYRVVLTIQNGGGRMGWPTPGKGKPHAAGRPFFYRVPPQVQTCGGPCPGPGPDGGLHGPRSARWVC
jgi:hypothetical protein